MSKIEQAYRVVNHSWDSEIGLLAAALVRSAYNVYTIESAQWANVEKTSAVIFTMEHGAVALSAADTPDWWGIFEKWRETNPVADVPPPPPPPPRSVVELLQDELAALRARLEALEGI